LVRSPRQPSVPEDDDDDDAWAREYAAYCAEKEATSTATEKPNQSPDQDGAEEDSWEAQYAAYCAEKEAMLQCKDRENNPGTP
jgi:hypothetical protein